MTPPQIPATATLARNSTLSAMVAELNLEENRRQQAEALLSADPAVIDRAVVRITSVATRLLPVGVLAPVEKAAYGRFRFAEESTICAHVCDGLRLVQPLGLKLGPDPARLGTLPRRWRTYRSFRLLGARIVNLGMDQRALLAAAQSVLIGQALAHIQARFRDPALTEAQRSKLLDDFGPALVELERVLSEPVERKQELKGQQLTLQEQLAEAEAAAAYAATQLKLRQKLLVPREELLAAARRHQELKKKGQKDPPPAPGTGPIPDTTPRRII